MAICKSQQPDGIQDKRHAERESWKHDAQVGSSDPLHQAPGAAGHCYVLAHQGQVVNSKTLPTISWPIMARSSSSISRVDLNQRHGTLRAGGGAEEAVPPPAGRAALADHAGCGGPTFQAHRALQDCSHCLQRSMQVPAEIH